MPDYPPSVDRLIRALKLLPSVGARSAERMALHLLKRPAPEGREIAQAITAALDTVRPCPRCGFFSEDALCHICADPKRDPALIAVVQEASDILVIERSHAFRGHYHVLGGVLSPLDGVGPDQLRITPLVERARSGTVQEIIIALGTDVRSETTRIYLSNELKPFPLRISQLATGISAGGPLEFADPASLACALQDRKPLG